MRGGSEYNRALWEGDQNITEPYNREDHQNISEPYGRGSLQNCRALLRGGVIRIQQSLRGGGHKNITEPYEGGGAWEYNWALWEDQINFIFTQLKNFFKSIWIYLSSKGPR